MLPTSLNAAFSGSSLVDCLCVGSAWALALTTLTSSVTWVASSVTWVVSLERFLLVVPPDVPFETTPNTDWEPLGVCSSLLIPLVKPPKFPSCWSFWSFSTSSERVLSGLDQTHMKNWLGQSAHGCLSDRV